MEIKHLGSSIAGKQPKSGERVCGLQVQGCLENERPFEINDSNHAAFFFNGNGEIEKKMDFLRRWVGFIQNQ